MPGSGTLVGRCERDLAEAAAVLATIDPEGPVDAAVVGRFVRVDTLRRGVDQRLAVVRGRRAAREGGARDRG